MENNPDHPPVHAEGWYSSNQTVHRADGPSVLSDALEAWEGMRPTTTPLESTPVRCNVVSANGRHGALMVGL